MKTIKSFIEENNLKVSIDVVNDLYVCHISDGDDTFAFKMTKEKLTEHIKRFMAQPFVNAILDKNELMKTHFLRLAVTWWHIQTMGDELPREVVFS